MAQERLIHLIYTSAAVGRVDAAMLHDVLKTSRDNNALRSVSGMLLYSDGSFFQVLEGEEATLESLYGTIVADPRHAHVTRIIHEPIARRDFGNWTMGFVDATANGAESLEGFSDFFGEGTSLAALPAGRARKILDAFSKGRWRPSLQGAPG
jgi:FAD-dependent sensor of blue light